MNKVIMLLISFISLSIAKAQEQKEKSSFFKVEYITVGVMLTGGVSYTHIPGEKPLALFYTVSPSLNLVTTKTHDHVMYEVVSNSFQTLNGYLLPRNWDIYCFYQKNLKTPDQYGSIGIEKVIVPDKAEWLDIVFFIEAGTDFSGLASYSTGITLHPQWIFFDRSKTLKKVPQINL